jgi:RimJ/RimL family protein N-acetyltransferase
VIDYGFGIQLGPITMTVAAQAYVWRNERAIYKWCRQYEPLPPSTHEAWLKSLESAKDIKMYAVKPTNGSHAIGVCGLTSIDLINRHAEFSLYLGPESHGKGLGEPALKTLCAHGFNALGLCHIFGETFDGNPAAQTFEKVGFKKEGTRRSFYFRDGKFIDAHLYSVLAYEFKSLWNC